MPSPTDDELMGDSPPSIDPYEILGLDAQATADQVKSAYRKQALKHHPDKATPESKDVAHVKFQKVSFAYAILSNPRRRSRYDATGSTAESLDAGDDDFNWVDFFRSQKAEMVDGEAIQKIKDEYQHSAEERADLLVAFERSQGDMDAVYEEMMCSNVLDDDQRFRKIIDDAISSKEVTGWTCYKETAKQKLKRVKKAKREEIEAREYAEQLGVADKLFGDTKKDNKIDDASALAALIQQRQKSRADNSFENLEAKYGGGGKNSGKINKRTIMDEPPEEAFEKNRKKKLRA